MQSGAHGRISGMARGGSPSDVGPRGIHALRRKMAAYLANGAQLRWLLIPEQQAVEIWRPTGEIPLPVSALNL
jgi:hypothetical protein